MVSTPQWQRRRTHASTVLALFQPEGPLAFLMVVARWLTCPVSAVERALPMDGRVLEVGCGRGLISASIAVGSPDRCVTATDVDPKKIDLALRICPRMTAAGLRPIDFAVAPSGEIPQGPWDAIVFAEVLYLMTVTERQQILAQCAAELSADGVIVIKEVDCRPRWKHALNRIHNWVLKRILHDLEGGATANSPPEVYLTILRGIGVSGTATRLDRWYPYAHFMVVGRKAPTGDG